MVERPRLTPQGEISRRGEVPVVRPSDVVVPRFSNMGSPDLSAINATIGNYSTAASYYEQAKNSYLGLASDLKAEREAAERKQKELYLAQLKSQAIRRATEIEIENYRNVDGFDKSYGAYSQETINGLDPSIRTEAAITLMNIGTSSAGSIMGRVKTQEEQIHNVELQTSFDADLDSMVNRITETGNFETELPRKLALEEQIKYSSLNAEAKLAWLDKVDSRTRKASLLRMAREHYDDGNYDMILPSLMNAMDNSPLGEGLGEDERYKLAAEVLNTITPLERQRQARENEAEENDNKVKAKNYDDAIAAIVAHDADPESNPPLTIDMLNNIPMKGSNKLAIYELLTSDGLRQTNEEWENEFWRLTRTSPEAAEEHFEDGLKYKLIGRADLGKFHSALGTSLDKEGYTSPLSASRKVITDTLNMFATINNAKDPTIPGKIKRAVQELEMREKALADSLEGGVENPEYLPQLQKIENDVLRKYNVYDVNSMKHNQPLPYGYGGNRNDITTESLDASEAALDAAMEPGGELFGNPALARKYIEEINMWRELLEKEKMQSNERANGR